MQNLTQRFDQKGVVKLKLEIFQSNQKVINFYQALGWKTRPELITMSKTLRKLEK
jgi:ribosomal protein S18 acetylase RimI-like enzyme